MKTTRREFLTQGVGGASLLTTGTTLPGFLLQTAEAVCLADDERILIVVQLTGGNGDLDTAHRISRSMP